MGVLKAHVPFWGIRGSSGVHIYIKKDIYGGRFCGKYLIHLSQAKPPRHTPQVHPTNPTHTPRPVRFHGPLLSSYALDSLSTLRISSPPGPTCKLAASTGSGSEVHSMLAMSRQLTPVKVQFPAPWRPVTAPVKPPSTWSLSTAIYLPIPFSALAQHPAVLTAAQVEQGGTVRLTRLEGAWFELDDLLASDAAGLLPSSVRNGTSLRAFGVQGEHLAMRLGSVTISRNEIVVGDIQLRGDLGPVASARAALRNSSFEVDTFVLRKKQIYIGNSSYR